MRKEFAEELSTKYKIKKTDLLEKDIILHEIISDPKRLGTSVKGVFAAGDCVTGSSSLAEAIAAGKRASVEIDRYLMSADLDKS